LPTRPTETPGFGARACARTSWQMLGMFSMASRLPHALNGSVRPRAANAGFVSDPPRRISRCTARRGDRRCRLSGPSGAGLRR
jgi:hypothetical protein